MAGGQMLDEAGSLAARLVPEAERSGVAAIDERDAFKPRSDRRQALRGAGLCSEQLAATGDLYLTAAHDPSQTLSRTLAHLFRLVQHQGATQGGVHDRSRK